MEKLKNQLLNGQEIFGYIYILELNSNEPLNFNKKGTRKILPMHVQAFVDNNENLYYRRIKNGRIQAKKIPHSLFFKPDIKFFEYKEDMIKEFNKDLKKINENLRKYEDNLKNLKNEINSHLNLE